MHWHHETCSDSSSRSWQSTTTGHPVRNPHTLLLPWMSRLPAFYMVSLPETYEEVTEVPENHNGVHHMGEANKAHETPFRVWQTMARTFWRRQSPPTEWRDYWQLTCWHCGSTCHFWKICPHESDEDDDQYWRWEDRHSANERELVRTEHGRGRNAAAAHVYRIRASRGPCSLRTEYSRTDQPVCWQCGGVGHLRKNGWQEFPQKHSPEENRDWSNKQKKWRRRWQFHYSRLLIIYSACRKSTAMTVYMPRGR
jgi:hypothetical protein